MILNNLERNFVNKYNNGIVQHYIKAIYHCIYSGRKVSLDEFWLLGKTNNFNRFIEVLKYIQDKK